MLDNFLGKVSDDLCRLFGDQVESNKLAVARGKNLDLLFVNGLQPVSKLAHLDLVAVDQHDVGRLENFNVVLSGEEISVSTETFVVHRHLSVNDLVANYDVLVRVDYFLSQGAFYTVTSEYDTIFWVRSPLDKEFTTGSILEHTWRCNDDKWQRRFCNRVKLVDRLELEWILTTFELHTKLVSHEVPMRVKDGQRAIRQVTLIVDWDVRKLISVCPPVFVQN